MDKQVSLWEKIKAAWRAGTGTPKYRRFTLRWSARKPFPYHLLGFGLVSWLVF